MFVDSNEIKVSKDDRLLSVTAGFSCIRPSGGFPFGDIFRIQSIMVSREKSYSHWIWGPFEETSKSHGWKKLWILLCVPFRVREDVRADLKSYRNRNKTIKSASFERSRDGERGIPYPHSAPVALDAGRQLSWDAEVGPSKSACGKACPQRAHGSPVGKSWHLLHFVTQDSRAVLTVRVGLG